MHKSTIEAASNTTKNPTKTSSNTPVVQSSQFLNLPAEVRWRIYGIFLDQVIVLRPHAYRTRSNRQYRKSSEPSHYVSLLFTCRQTRTEVLNLWRKAQVTLFIPNNVLNKRLLKQLPRCVQNSVTKIVFCEPADILFDPV